MHFSLLLLLVVCSAGLLYCVSGLPPLTCDEYFQYLSEGDLFIGKLTLPNLPNEAITLDLELSQHVLADGKYNGNLSFWTDVETFEKHLENGEPIEYRVLFSNQKELPKVTRIAVNAIEICTAEEYPLPSQTIVLQHWYEPEGAQRKVIPIRKFKEHPNLEWAAQ